MTRSTRRALFCAAGVFIILRIIPFIGPVVCAYIVYAHGHRYR